MIAEFHIFSMPRRLAMIAKLPGAGSYDAFAYDVGLLKDFVREDDEDGGPLTSSLRTGGGRKKRIGSGLNRSHNTGSLRGSFRGGSFRGGTLFGRKPKRDGLDGSLHSAGSLRGRNNFGKNGTTSSLHT